MNRKIILVSHPEGPVKLENFELVEEETTDLPAAMVRVKVDTLSIDAFIRTTLDGGGFHQAARLRGVVPALGVGTVVESNDPAFAVGDWVFGPLCSQSVATLPGAALRKLDVSKVPATAFLGALGLATGLTAYVGIKHVGAVAPGDTVVVSGAAGAVGSLASQVARLCGATKVVGIAGGPRKVEYLLSELGCTHAIDYRNEDVNERLKQIAPDGVDVFFDNVGGDVLDAVLLNLAVEARVVLCGAVSQYENMADIRGPKNYLKIAERDASLRGFTIFHYAHLYEEAEAAMASWLSSGDLVLPEHVEHGIENFPRTVRLLLDGGHHGKLLLRP